MNAHMKWIGLSGGIATGKSAVSQELRSRGLTVVDADVVARDVVAVGSPGLAQVVSRFGATILNPDGSLDRKRLGQTVFKNSKDLQDLERILHPLIQNEVRQQKKSLAQSKVEVAFYDVALLFEKKMESQFFGTVCVWCRPEQQLERLMERDQLDRDQANLRLKAQIPVLEKIKMATWTIDNSKDFLNLKTEVDRVLKSISLADGNSNF